MVAVIAAPRTADILLSDARHLVNPALRAAVNTLPQSMRHICGYHLGWWETDGTPADADPGKALRPALVFGGALAVGGADLDAVTGAAAVELIHNFSLLHDDVMDGDLTRRHRPTAWSVFGASPAILAGDALLALAMDLLAGGGTAASTRATGMLASAVQRLLDGQNADLDFEDRAEVGVDECLAMASAKTGALLGCACAMGALMGGGRPGQVLRLAQFGEDLGLAFQFADDLLGIWGDPSVTGKPVHSDLRSRKKSLPVVAALASGTAAGRTLAEAYAGPAPDDLGAEAELIEAAGARVWAQARADELLDRACEALAAAGPEPRAEAELVALARRAVRRSK